MGTLYYTLSNWRYKRHSYGELAHVGSDHKREDKGEKNRAKKMGGFIHAGVRRGWQRKNMKKELLYRIPTCRMTMERVKTRVFRYVFTTRNQMSVYTDNPDRLPPAVYRRLQMGKAA